MGRHRLEPNGRDLQRPNGGARMPRERRTRITEGSMTMPIGRISPIEGGRPGDRRGFLHKSFIGRAIGGAVKGFVTGGPLGAIKAGAIGALTPRTTRTARTVPRIQTARPSGFSEDEKERGRNAKIPFTPIARNGNGCADPRLVMAPDGHCVAPGSGHFLSHFPGGGNGAVEVGETMVGRFGAGVRPTFQTIERSVCLRGMTLGLDGLCYNKGAISNKQRMWPRGRRPLLTGGDMRAIGIAARAGARLDRTTTRLRQLGMMKALPKGRAKKCPPKHAPGQGMTVVQN